MIDLKSFAYGFLACAVIASCLYRPAVNASYETGYQSARRELEKSFVKRQLDLVAEQEREQAESESGISSPRTDP